MTYLVIHGHFYQPPRENPWTGIVDREPSAGPYHDWNERILHECYRANAFARVQDSSGRVTRILNNYERISYNFGPTLLSWLEAHAQETYQRVLQADRESAARNEGHGNAIAQCYNHVILPLCNERDLVTQIRWGVADFRHRFGRAPEAMWMAETACNDQTLCALIDEGMKFAILSPYQASHVRPIGDERGDWVDVQDGSVDTGVAYRYTHSDGSGRSLALFFYDGSLSRGIAFEGLLYSADRLVDRLSAAAGGKDRLVHLATDGESYGHHTRFGEMGLGYALYEEAPRRGFKITNYGAFLERHPPSFEARIKPGPGGEGTAWSCAHGVGRWYRDCGCQGGGEPGWNQQWRGPLRAAFDLLRDSLAPAFEDAAGDLFRDPWPARDAYVQVILDRSRESRKDFFRRHSRKRLSEADQVRGARLLELQRHSMLMYTSCGWFFSEVSGIEGVQVMKYAGRVLDLASLLGWNGLREPFLEQLAEARSNLPQMGNGADVFRRFVDPCRTPPGAAAAHVAMSRLVGRPPSRGSLGVFAFRRRTFRVEKHGRLTLATGRVSVTNTETGEKHDCSAFAAHLGGVDFHCSLCPYPGREAHRAASHRVFETARKAPLLTILRVAQENFGAEEYGLEHILPVGREAISREVFRGLVDRLTEQFSILYDENRRTIHLLQDAGFPLPNDLKAAVEFVLGQRFDREAARLQAGADGRAYQRALQIAEEVQRGDYSIDPSLSRDRFTRMLEDALETAVETPGPDSLERVYTLLRLSKQLGVQPDLRRPQEILCSARPAALESSGLRELAGWLNLAPAALPKSSTGE